MSTVVSIKNNFPDRIKTGLNDSWFLVRAPGSLYLGLKKKWLVPGLLLLSLLLVPTLFLPITHMALEKIYPSTTKDKLVRLFKTNHQNELLATRKTQAAALLWLLFGTGVTFGLVLYAPVVRQASDDENMLLQKPPGDPLPENSLSGLDDRYTIKSEIGSGAMGVVYSAIDRTLERRVALKELPSVFVRDSERRVRFRREALTLAKLTHPGIVHIYDLLDDNRRMILVMELVSGGTLEDLIARKAPFSIDDTCRMIQSVCETLHHVHQNDIIHRDLKPANILIDERGNLKVTDFGLARLRQDSDLTIDGSIFGSPKYMSPEQAEGKTADHRSDIYSLGIIFYELITGAPPFNGAPALVMAQQISKEPTPPVQVVDSVTQDFSDLIMSMLVKDPDNRLVDLQEIRSRLQHLCEC